MKLSFATLGCPKWTLEQIAANAKAMGFDGVELRGVAGEHIGPEETPAERARIRKLFDSHGIQIAAIMGYSSFTMDDPAKLKESIRLAQCFLETAKDIGCPTLRLFGGVFSKQLDEKANMARVAEGVKRVAGAAERTGVNIALETHDDWTNGARLKALITSVGSPRVGACWDAANGYFSEPPEVTCAALRDCLMHVHFKDAAMVDGKIKSKLPGTGQLDLKKLLSLIIGTGYDRYLSFEWEKKWEPDLEEPEVAFPVYVKLTRNLLKEATKGKAKKARA
jgi:sugar phosphate isomerase/epimerase